MELLKDQAGQKGIEMKIESARVSTRAWFDEHMTDIVIRNLLSNAIKYSQPGGRVSVTYSEGAEGFLVVQIKDNGVGMESVQLEGLFKIDQTISTEGTTGETGTGLGLILCKEFVERQGGKIWVESEPAKGSVFSFSLPRNS